MTILLVDDETELVATLAERLAMRGFTVDWADSGAKAIEMVQNNSIYDIAVLDVKMPEIGGLELQKRLAEIAPDMKYIFLTGNASTEDFIEGSAHSYSYLIKPVRIEKLIEQIQSAVK